MEKEKEKVSNYFAVTSIHKKLFYYCVNTQLIISSKYFRIKLTIYIMICRDGADCTRRRDPHAVTDLEEVSAEMTTFPAPASHPSSSKKDKQLDKAKKCKH